jgi:hypothetical protein
MFTGFFAAMPFDSFWHRPTSRSGLAMSGHVYFWFELPRGCSSFRFMNMNLVEAKNRSPHLQCQGQNPRFSANQNGDDTCERQFSPCSLFR